MAVASVAPSLLRAQNSEHRVSIELNLLSELSNARRVAVKPGEICIVCGQAVGADDDAYLVNGQRLAVHKQRCEMAFAKQPGKYLGHLRPHGSQFMDTMTPNAGSLWGPWWAWLALGLFVVAGLICAGLCAYRALNRSINPIPWFFAGLFLNVLGYVWLLTRPGGQAVPSMGDSRRGLVKIPATYMPRACPKCRTPNHPAAAVCANCGSALRPVVESEVARAGLQHS